MNQSDFETLLKSEYARPELCYLILMALDVIQENLIKFNGGKNEKIKSYIYGGC